MKPPPRLLIVDDEAGIRISLRGILEDEGYQIFDAESAEAGLAFLERESVDLLFLDIWLPEMDGLTMLEKVRGLYPSLPILMISGHGTIETAVNAIKKGAHDFIEKPLSLEKVIIAVERALEFQALKRENTGLRDQLAERDAVGPMGTSRIMVTLREQINRVAPLDTWVLINGENGTGKELVARAVHNASKRRNRPLVALNCAAIPEELIESELFGHEKGAFTGADSSKVGKFEMAHQGTLFLDEIGDMSMKTQAKILRILQEKTYERVGGNKVFHADVRVIAATNKDLEKAIENGEFREDLYYRLKVFPLHVPPLRERGEDILLLMDFFSLTLAQDLALAPISFAQDACDILLAYQWPGNVRELRNFIERMLILHAGEKISGAQLPSEFQGAQQKSPARLVAGEPDEPGGPSVQAAANGSLILPPEALSSNFKDARSVFEARFLAAKLQEYDGNISRLAEGIGLERSYLYRKLKAYNIQGT